MRSSGVNTVDVDPLAVGVLTATVGSPVALALKSKDSPIVDELAICTDGNFAAIAAGSSLRMN